MVVTLSQTAQLCQPRGLGHHALQVGAGLVPAYRDVFLTGTRCLLSEDRIHLKDKVYLPLVPLKYVCMEL